MNQSADEITRRMADESLPMWERYGYSSQEAYEDSFDES